MNTGVWELPQIGDWQSWEELHDLQMEQLPHSVANAKRAPFYRTRLPEDPAAVTSLSDLSRLPLTNKQDLREAYPFGMLAVPKERLVHYFESSGTTGSPTSSYFTEEDWSRSCNARLRRAVQLTESDTLMVKLPYTMSSTALAAHEVGRRAGAMVVSAGIRSAIMPFMRVVQLLRELDVTVAAAISSQCFLWAAAARYAGYDPKTDFPHLRAFWVTGESMSRAKRERISEIWGGVQVIEIYGSTEVHAVAGECPEGNLHLWADRFLPEIYEPETAEFKREGTGDLVLTSLYREAMPFIRYNTEDLVEISYSNCDCGWYLPVLKVHGRASGQFRVEDKSISPIQLEELVFRLPEAYNVLFWRARTTSSKLEIEIEVSQENKFSACSELTGLVATHLGVKTDIRGVPPGSLVSEEAFTMTSKSLKTRNLFQEDEDWAAALVQ